MAFMTMKSGTKNLARAIYNSSSPKHQIMNQITNTILEYVLPFTPEYGFDDVIEEAVVKCDPEMIALCVVGRSTPSRLGIFLNEADLSAHQIFDLGVKIEKTLTKLFADHGYNENQTR